MRTRTVARRAVVPEQPQSDMDAVVASVIRAHESVVRNLRRLAAAAVRPLDGDAQSNRQRIESLCYVPFRGTSCPAAEVVRR